MEQGEVGGAICLSPSSLVFQIKIPPPTDQGDKDTGPPLTRRVQIPPPPSDQGAAEQTGREGGGSVAWGPEPKAVSAGDPESRPRE